ncbi:linker for activation of T-cells family member 2 [Stegastes partitus]|uniref:Linker for activation of T-cells family member 2 n=1 Tax=Stegastes partitus TaxID=144197 RepID=A0A9Y4NL68_9TELE|nr:PREDICTED: linker for activation of T-cells family member 2-like [Stegastes partitus]
MTVSSSVLVVVLTVMSVASLSLMSLLCLRCRRKSKIKEVESQIYDPQTFQRGGSKFAVVRSTTVTRANQIMSTPVETPEEMESPAVQTLSSSLEHDYVAPIAISVYANEPTEVTMDENDHSPSDYENVFPSIQMTDDEDDYENTQFLDQVMGQQEDSEPDYVNEADYT